MTAGACAPVVDGASDRRLRSPVTFEVPPCLIAGTLLVPISHHFRMPFAAIGFASVVALAPGVYVFRMLSGLVQFAHLPTSNLLTSLTSDGATAVLVIAGMATGLAVPMHAYSTLSAAADKRRNQHRW
jgi:uncharacterized membrane protein YjjB (DUF3815 family)